MMFCDDEQDFRNRREEGGGRSGIVWLFHRAHSGRTKLASQSPR